MVRIVVSAQQARQIGETHEPLEVVDEQGNHVAYFMQTFSQAEILEAKRRSEAEVGGRTTAEVLDRLAKLDSQ